MANLTLVIDEDVLRAARIRALEHGTSVNAVVRDYLTSYARREGAREAIAAFLGRAAESSASSGSGGRTWTREELYDRWDRPPRT